MAKANQKARFSIFNFFDASKVSLPENLDRKLVYLDYEEIINRIPQVEQALKDIKDRHRVEKHFLNFNNPQISQWVKDSNDEQKTLKHIDYSQKASDQIQRGFDIAEKWKDDDEFLDEVIAVGI